MFNNFFPEEALNRIYVVTPSFNINQMFVVLCKFEKVLNYNKYLQYIFTLFFEKIVEVVGEGSAINWAYPA